MFGSILSDIGSSIFSDFIGDENRDDQQGFANRQAESSRAFNAREAQKARDWEEKMANTRYQRGVDDLRAAGLNPMMAYMNSAASYGTAHAATSSPAVAGASSAGENRPATASMQSASQIEVNQALVDRTKAEADKIRAEEQEVRARTPTHAVSMDQMQQNIRESQERIKEIMSRIPTHAASAANLAQQTANLKETLPQIREHVRQLQALTQLNKAQAIEAGARTTVSDAQYDEIRQRIRQNLPEIQKALAELEAKARSLDMPRRGMEAATHQSFIGALSAVLRALNPFANLSGAIK